MNWLSNDVPNFSEVALGIFSHLQLMIQIFDSDESASGSKSLTNFWVNIDVLASHISTKELDDVRFPN